MKATVERKDGTSFTIDADGLSGELPVRLRDLQITDTSDIPNYDPDEEVSLRIEL